MNIGPTLAKTISPQTISRLKFMEQPAINSIFLPDVTSDEMKSIVLPLKSGAAAWDDITPQILTMIHHSVNHIIPKEQKIANVLPLFKACDPCVLTTIVQCLYYVYHQMFMRRLCIIMKYNFIFIIHNQILPFPVLFTSFFLTYGNPSLKIIYILVSRLGSLITFEDSISQGRGQYLRI